MGTSAAETVKEIEETRDRIEAEIRELEDRLPRPAVWTKRLVGVAVGGGIGGSMFWFGVRRIRKRRTAKQQAAQPVQAIIQVLPDSIGERVSSAIESGEARTWAIGIGAAWLVVRLAELRTLRRMNRAMLAAR
jgi:hypothetical protein